MKHYFNKEAFIEGLCCLFFAGSLFSFTVTGKYLFFVTPRLKPYLYFSVLVVLVWAVSCFLKLPSPQYRLHLNRFLVLVIPTFFLFLPYSAENASENPFTSLTASAGSDTSSVNSSSTASVNEASSSTEASASAQDSSETQQETAVAQSQTHQIELPSGLDEENRSITVHDEDFYAWILQLCYYPDRYDGFTIHIHGSVYHDDTMNENEFAVTRLLMTCCVADLSNCGPLCIWDDADTLTPDAWVNVTGTYHYDKNKGMEITVSDVQSAGPAKEQYIYPIY